MEEVESTEAKMENRDESMKDDVRPSSSISFSVNSFAP
jgi:hypothetical protein